MQRSAAYEVRFRFSTSLLAGISFHVVLDQGTEIYGVLGADVAVQRVVVERGYFFVCDKSHKRQRGALLCGARPPGRGYDIS
jgi:hypothetical protein